MFNIKSVVDTLKVRRKKIDIKYGTPLSSLAGKINPVLEEDKELNKIVDMFIQGNTHLFDYILPSVKNYTNMVNESTNNIISRYTVENEYKIIPFEIPAWVRQISKRNEFLQLSDTPRDTDQTVINRLPNEDEIRDYPIILDGTLEDSTKEYLRLFTTEELIRIWKTYISDAGGSNTNYKGMSLTRNPKRADVFMVFLFIRKLRIEAIDSGVNMDRYDPIYHLLKLQINNILDIDARQRQLGTMVFNVIDKDIYVNGQVYDEYLSAGGDVMAIIGGVTTTHTLTRDVLNEDSEKFIRIANNGQNASVVEKQKERARFIRSSVIQSYTPFMTNLQEEDPTLKTYNVAGNYDKMVKIVNSYEFSNVLDIAEICEEILLSLVYQKSYLSEYIRKVKDYLAMDNSINLQRAGTYALIEVVTKYYMGQTEITDYA